MFAARRSVQRLARGFATVAVDSSAPTSSLTVVVKAGSRFESKQGVANALKNFAFKVCVGSCMWDGELTGEIWV
jgi:ubiquinol-cytochrome c reductase core subunit 2